MSYYIVGRLCFVGYLGVCFFCLSFVFVRRYGNWWGYNGCQLKHPMI